MATLENCPLCGRRLEKGYVTTSNAIQWSWNETPRWVRRGDEKLVGSYWIGTCHKALRCSNCNLVLFFYEKKVEALQNNEEPKNVERLYE